MPKHSLSTRWRDRLKVPNYRIGEAARYAGVAPATVAAWHSPTHRKAPPLPSRAPRAQLSYLELIEVAVVGKFRKVGVSLPRIREAREYMSKQFESEFPFASYRFATDGKELVLDYEQVIGSAGKGKTLWPSRNGQLAWNEIMGPLLKEFEYEEALAARWHVAGVGSPILIDPHISFGSPSVRGVPTWVLKERFNAGEPLMSTADDFGLARPLIESALRFEGLDPNIQPQSGSWRL